MAWHPSLSVGIDLIDEQHQEWFRRAEQLFEAGKQGKAKEYVGEMLDFLESYTKKHFADEEAYMRRINYPGYEEQRKAHASFVARLEDLRAEYDESGGSLTVIISANKMVIDWLTQHISKMDKKIGDFVREQERK